MKRCKFGRHETHDIGEFHQSISAHDAEMNEMAHTLNESPDEGDGMRGGICTKTEDGCSRFCEADSQIFCEVTGIEIYLFDRSTRNDNLGSQGGTCKASQTR